MNAQELTNLLDSFLERWSLDDVKKMSLQEYVGVNNHDTFCYWVETKTRSLGSFKGSSSFAFGIYERKTKEKVHKNYRDDEKYSWMSRYGENRNEAFENVKSNLIQTIEFAEKGNFALIDGINLPHLFKWKVAFLYSNERLIPIYKRETLNKIAENFGLKITGKTKISDIQELMMQNKPANKSVHEYMSHLWNKFGKKSDKDGADEKIEEPQANKLRTRKASDILNIKPQIRTVAYRSAYVEQKHKKLQLALKKKLIKEFGESSVVLFEENDIDVKLFQPNHLVFYEVKTAPYAANCIREALGQLLHYSFSDKDLREKKLVVVGQYSPTPKDLKFIEYLKSLLNIEFEYESVSLN
ncbi:MAG: hypothetical protein MSG64_10310 [Pyrinomonadaceae bacterium MAG19_C2-C3]|nr:hypothetical protein [Pyrinomonadaceae bacterium MAG19_C2-C3]